MRYQPEFQSHILPSGIAAVIALVILICLLAAGATIGSPVVRESGQLNLQGYDFSHVVDKLSTSIDPLEQEMEASFNVFISAVNEADQLLSEGDARGAVEKASVAVRGVMEVKNKVLNPMWDGQQFLSEQINWVRRRLARALAVDEEAGVVKRDKRTEALLDSIARKIPDETDPIRKKWLIAHYRTIRDLAHIKRMTDKLSPDQRKLWVNVLGILDEASLAHQQVLMGSEVLFAHFEATAQRLDEYVTLLDTVDGASELLSMIRGLDGTGSEMAAFTSSMGELQNRLGEFNSAIEGALQENLFELEAKIDAIQPDDEFAQANTTGVVSVYEDDELAARIAALQKQDAPN